MDGMAPRRGRVIAVHGMKYAGKSAVTSRLINRHGFKAASLALPLKNMLAVYLDSQGMQADLVNECLYGSLKEAPVGVLGGKSPRFAMQVLGMEYRDTLTPDLLIGIHGDIIKAGAAAGENLAVEDLRFNNELDRFEQVGVETWMVESAATAGRADAPASADLLEAVRPGAFTPTAESLARMISSLLGHCGVGPATVRRCLEGDLADAPIAKLGDKSTRFSLDALKDVWVASMKSEVKVTTALTAAHLSEAGLPRDRFRVILGNNGTLEDLYRQVDEALVSGLVTTEAQ
jgi:hypothetical protein